MRHFILLLFIISSHSCCDGDFETKREPLLGEWIGTCSILKIFPNDSTVLDIVDVEFSLKENGEAIFKPTIFFPSKHNLEFKCNPDKIIIEQQPSELLITTTTRNFEIIENSELRQHWTLSRKSEERDFNTGLIVRIDVSETWELIPN